MKIAMLIVGIIFSTHSVLAGFCSIEQSKRGCHDEVYDCDRPTHYQCRSCVCPTSKDFSVDLSNEDSSALPASKNTFEFVALSKTVCNLRNEH